MKLARTLSLAPGLVALAVFLTAMVGLTEVADATRPLHSPQHCEEGQPVFIKCVWDAEHMGNGEGLSFIKRSDGTIRFITHRRAHRLAY